MKEKVLKGSKDIILRFDKDVTLKNDNLQINLRGHSPRKYTRQFERCKVNNSVLPVSAFLDTQHI